jgi:site-specific DNA-methyltransferase (adenine-specific)
MACRIEDGGFEIRDMIAWVYGSGFPKSLDVSKAIDKAAGAERCLVPASGGLHKNANLNDDGWNKIGQDSPTMWSGTPATEAAKQWSGWGTAVKPALEPITLARKPLIGTVAANVLEHGLGGINVDGCRVGANGATTRSHQAPYAEGGWRTGHCIESLDKDRWPANLIHDGSDEVTLLFPMTGKDKSAARFFYCAKASRSERGNGNNHPTVKPVNLMAYLCRLVTPRDGVVLDPFTGSGTTGVAAIREGFRFIGIEREEAYFNLSKSRVAAEVA